MTGDAREHAFTLDASDGQRLAWLYAHGEVLADEDADTAKRRVRVRLTPRELGRFVQLETREG